MNLFYLLLIIYCLLFIYLTWKNFSWGLILLFALLPTYLIRFNLGPLPTTLLELMLGIITIIWLIKYNRSIIPSLWSIAKKYKTLFIAISLFLLAATISLFTSVDLRTALGEWKAFYIEPIIILLILITHYPACQSLALAGRQLPITKNFVNKILFALILCGFITSLLAISQHFTGWLVPTAFWENQNTFRVTAWYGFPNAVGLFLAPLVPLAFYLAKQNWTNKHSISNYQLLITLLFILTSILAIIFSKGTGALIGWLGGIIFLLSLYKKTRWYTVVLGLISLVCLFSLPQLSSLRQELFLQDRSGQIRLSIWQETLAYLSDQPLAGAGLASYVEKIEPYHTTVNGGGVEIFHHPHNIFLTMWVNLGLLGVLSFVAILIWFFHHSSLITDHSAQEKQNKNFHKLPVYLAAAMLIIVIMGLVDSPYIKNDLSILFWLLPALLLISQYDLENQKT